VTRIHEYRLGRQLTLQFLYSLEFNDLDWQFALPEFWKMNPVALSCGYFGMNEQHELAEANDKDPAFQRVRAFVEQRVTGICEAKEELEKILGELLDNWRPERVGRVEWTISKIALYELRCCSDCPEAIVFSEANRLAALFCDDNSARFITGLLNRIVQQDEKPIEITAPSPEQGEL
jgi:N utilization substance protein B